VEDEFEQISFMMTDEVTGLLNKRGFLKRGEEQILTLSQKTSLSR
jgi:GGDEF domain-containing protein